MDRSADESLAEAPTSAPPMLPPAVVVLPGPRAALAEAAGAQEIAAGPARLRFQKQAALVAHAGLTARRLGLTPPTRSPDLYDALELYAFVRPAQFCAPSAAGLARALGWAEP